MTKGKCWCHKYDAQMVAAGPQTVNAAKAAPKTTGPMTFHNVKLGGK